MDTGLTWGLSIPRSGTRGGSWTISPWAPVATAGEEDTDIDRDRDKWNMIQPQERRKSYLYNIDEVQRIMPSRAEGDKVVRDHFSVDSVKTILTETESGGYQVLGIRGGGGCWSKQSKLVVIR